MKNYTGAENRVEVFERVRILGNETLCLSKIYNQLLIRANQENISDEKAIKLLDFMNSFEFFSEMESWFFWFYDPNNLELWSEILDHVYYRSITETYSMN